MIVHTFRAHNQCRQRGELAGYAGPAGLFLSGSARAHHHSPDDGVIFNVPLGVATANLISAGHVPLWNPYLFSGMRPTARRSRCALSAQLVLLIHRRGGDKPNDARHVMVAALGAIYARRAGANITGAMPQFYLAIQRFSR